jgi:MoxR-like ATPase
MKAHPQQLIQIVCHQARLLWADPAQARLVAPVFAHGAPGTGKSAAFEQAARELGVGFRDLRLAQYEPTDLRGLPVPQDGFTTWLPSAELPWQAGTRGILLLDELTSADRSVQAAAYQLVLDRCVGPMRLADGWLVCAAGNRTEDRAISHTLSSALANRFCHVEIEPDLTQWTAWARARGLAHEVLAFLRYRPERFFSMDGALDRGWPSPRSWERVSHALATGAGLDRATLEIVIEGLVGRATAVEFAAFREHLRELPDAVDLLLGRTPLRVPPRADQRYALCASLAWHLWRAPGPLDERLGNFLRFGLQLGSDFATMAMLDATRDVPGDTDGQLTTALFAHPLYEDWSRRHGQAWQTSEAVA